MIRAVVFDFNGILVDDESVHCDLLLAILAEQGAFIDEQQYHDEYLGFDDRCCFETALARAGQDTAPERIAALIAEKARRYHVWAQTQLATFPGAAEAVRSLAQDTPVAICSGALRPEIEIGLERLQVRDRVSLIVAAEDTSRCKPDPEGYLLALEGLRSQGLPDLHAAECLVIEDSLAGIESALRAGMRPVGVAHTYTANELRTAGALAVLDNLLPLNRQWVDDTFGTEAAPLSGCDSSSASEDPEGKGASAVLVVCSDLIFTAKIQGTARALGVETVMASRADQVSRCLAEGSFAALLIDLAAGPAVSAANLTEYRRAAPTARLIAFGSHVDTERLEEASAAGCDLVMPRSRFTIELARLLSELGG